MNLLEFTREKILSKLEKAFGRSRETFPEDVIRRTLLTLLNRGFSTRKIAQTFDIECLDLLNDLMANVFRSEPALTDHALGNLLSPQQEQPMIALPPTSSGVVRRIEYVNSGLEAQEAVVEVEEVQTERSLRSVAVIPARKQLPPPGGVRYLTFKQQLDAQVKILPTPFFGLTPKQKEEARDLIPDVYGPDGSEEKIARYRGVTISEVIPEMRVLWLPPSNLWKQFITKFLQKRGLQQLLNASELGIAMSYLFAVECSELSLEECARRFGCMDRQTSFDDTRAIDALMLEAYEQHPKSQRFKRPTEITAIDQFLDEARFFRLEWKRSKQSMPRLSVVTRS